MSLFFKIPLCRFGPKKLAVIPARARFRVSTDGTETPAFRFLRGTRGGEYTIAVQQWLMYSLAALTLWGLWGAFGKLASRSMEPTALMLLSYGGIVLVFPIIAALFARGINPRVLGIDAGYAVLSGFIAGLGFLFFYLALSTGKVTHVVVITAAYPIVTVLVAALFLAEPITLKSVLGVTLVVAGILLLAT
ncbi:MAG: EamA family transporter [Gammaproteobacteria bacterium]